jgi:uncharacterized protein DUF4388
VTLRGSTTEFPLESVVGLLAGTSKTGELQIRGGGQVGALGFAGGRLVAAVMDNEGGESALGAIFGISEAEFEFTPWASPPESNLEAGDLVALLKRAAEARDRLASIRAQIPEDRARFKLSEKAADSGAVTFTPDRWRALLAVNGERDVVAIAEQLRLGKMETLSLLAGLVKDGVIEILAPRAAEPEAAPAPTPYYEPEPAPPPVEAAAPPEPEVAPEPRPEWHAPEPTHEWAPPPPEAIPDKPEPAPATDLRPDLQAELAERFMEVPKREEAPPPPREQVPPAMDDRLASLTGIFAPGPAANAPPPPPPAAAAEPAPAPAPDDTWASPAPSQSSTASWMTPSPASSEAPANAWAPTTRDAQPEANPWLESAAPETPAPPPPGRDEWAGTQRVAEAPPTAAAPTTEAPPEKKRGGFLSRFRKEEPAPAAAITRMPAASVASKGGLLASLSNALLVEYGSYGKGKIETRMPNLLMRVDEQADPIDRPLPIVDDLIDATALEREGVAEEQLVPYLAALVRQIYEDAERAFGKDKAKKGYKAAQQQVFGNDNVLQSPDLAGKLPKV